MGNSAIEVVLIPEISVVAPTFTLVKSILPIEAPPLEGKSVLKSIFKILISWSFSNFSVGVNTNVFSSLTSISVEKSPNFIVVKSVVFSRR